jgi:hypothetical protein
MLLVKLAPTLFIRASLKAGGVEPSHPTRRTRMKIHADVRTCPNSHRLLSSASMRAGAWPEWGDNLSLIGSAGLW